MVCVGGEYLVFRESESGSLGWGLGVGGWGRG